LTPVRQDRYHPVYGITQKEDKPFLPIDVSFVEELDLDYDQNFLSFDFVALHYAAPEKNQYAYMMENLDTKWNECGTTRTASYTNIPPGDYIFRVKASNCDGVWNNEGRIIFITIHPPWWATWWFRSLAVLALAAGIIGYFRYRTASLRRRQKELEQTVKERTAEVVAQKEEITVQKHMVEEKQKEIIDSINYAQRIQRALLASDKLLQENLGEHFVLFKPKDIVAGDFYWGTPTEGKFMLITADCTGHGVPGAFMSLLNISKLNETIIEKKIIRPDLVLNNVRSEIIRSLNPNAGDNSQDGMDCVLFQLDLRNFTLQYAAANNGFYIVRNGSLISCSGDKMPVGKSHDDQRSFTLQTVELKPGDMIYTLTDGYPDQFGGPKGKKFKYKQLEELFVQIALDPIHAQKQKLDEVIEQWRGNIEQVDDICIIGIKIS
jgi:serine phosphatase RsbU (regulator of sigma subunit)